VFRALHKKTRKATLLLILSVISICLKSNPITAFSSCAVFNIPGQQPFLETYLTLVGHSLKAKKANGKLQNSVTIVFTLYKDTMIVKANKYNLKGPLYSDTTNVPSFIDNQRYALPNGFYKARFSIADNNDPGAAPLVITETVEVNFNNTEIQSSGVELLESYSRSQVQGPLTKSGFDLVPYTVNYYPESSRELSFYMETYNCDKILGEDHPFLYNYYLTTENGTIMNGYGTFRKQPAKSVNPLLAKMDISKLGTGGYYLNIEIKDEKNTLRLQKKLFFQRLNNKVDIVALQKQSEMDNMYPYFGNVTDADTLKMYVECLWPIADGTDKERIINQAVRKEPELMKKFVVDFWKRRAADSANPVKLWGNYYKEVCKAMAWFKCGKQPGYYTDRGRVFLQYGAPSQRSQQLNEPNTYPYEIWHYYRSTDAPHGMFFSNRKFIFVSHNLGDDCYELIHSDMRGEINNPRWQFEITRRNNNGLANPDNTVPAGTENNRFNDLYNSPR
jgi:GWxTD domain-containing protein